MSNDNSGYRPSAGERRAQDFAAKKLGEVLNGHGATVPVDWSRFGNPADSGATSGDRRGVDDPVTLEQMLLQVWTRYREVRLYFSDEEKLWMVEVVVPELHEFWVFEDTHAYAAVRAAWDAVCGERT